MLASKSICFYNERSPSNGVFCTELFVSQLYGEVVPKICLGEEMQISLSLPRSSSSTVQSDVTSLSDVLVLVNVARAMQAWRRENAG